MKNPEKSTLYLKLENPLFNPSKKRENLDQESCQNIWHLNSLLKSINISKSTRKKQMKKFRRKD